MTQSPLLLILLATGCPKLSDILGSVDIEQFKPTIKFKNLEIGAVDFTGADVEFVFAVQNPNPVDVNLASFTYDLGLAGASFLKGDKADGISLKAEGDSEMRLPVSVVFKDLLAARDNLSGKDVIPFDIKGDFGFNTPLGVVTIPYEEAGDFPMLQKPTVSFQQLRMGEIKLLQNSAKLELDLGVTHESASPLSFKDFDYKLSLQGTQVATGVLSQFASVDAGKEQTVTLPIELNLLDMGSTIVDLIKNKDAMEVGLKADLKVDTPYGELPLNLDKAKKLTPQ